MRLTHWLIAATFVALAGCETHSTQAQGSKDHVIEPAEVPEYIEQYQRLRRDLSLEFEGEAYPIHIEDMDTDENLIVIGYELGYVIVGFDMEEGSPTDDLFVVNARLPSEPSNAEKRELEGYDIELSEQGENLIYQVRLKDQRTGGAYRVRLVINEALLSTGSSQLNIEGDQATLSGSLGANTYTQINGLIDDHPGVQTLVLDQIEGSLDDAINMHTGRLIRNAELATRVTASSRIYSGGVDLFTAGHRRLWEAGAVVGVHSWCCENDKPADELGRDHPAHGPQLAYFRDMLGAQNGPDFYFFTIESAPFDGIHEMSREELTRYQLIKP